MLFISLGDYTTELVHQTAVRCVTVAGTVVLIYDTLLLLPDEICLVWSTLTWRRVSWEDSSGMKLLYLTARYLMIAVSIVALMTKLVLLPTQYRMGVVFYRLYKLWEFGDMGKWILGTVFIIGKAVVWIFTFVNMARIDKTIFYLDFGIYSSCATLLTPRLVLGVWIPDALLDIALVVFFFLNALSRPRLKSQGLIGIICKDGIQFFLVQFTNIVGMRSISDSIPFTTAMRMINVFFTALAPVSLFFLGTIFSGTMVTTVASRVFLGLFSAAQGYSQKYSRIS
ncbi:uncharacterized protein FOMMEDRAFT_29094 [Fomitiporia mediterranea MF3/22]|uniref:uncharacterized protein n=1 Tax=Fomitiporia mediterranea (strain MF3/22) TaxID=694068 RepID=UPI00044081A0|nr:uncharacterized protein FOMMEDRAFT_29094 [Fomitiporia mediterranea MF3/22]EJD01974.1 hypothetical protein FOMMEDRAFT_29094 [Fomitiporia mediterranea MF3/22]